VCVSPDAVYIRETFEELSTPRPLGTVLYLPPANAAFLQWWMCLSISQAINIKCILVQSACISYLRVWLPQGNDGFFFSSSSALSLQYQEREGNVRQI